MAVYSQTAVSIAVDTLELAGFANMLDMTATAEVLDATTFASGGWKANVLGLRSQMFNVSGFQDYATTGVDVTFPVSGLGGANVYTIGPTGGATAGDHAYFGAGRLVDYQPLKGNVGQLGEFAFGFTGDGRLVRGTYMHPSAARTATGTGTAVAFTTPTSTDTLFASFHVLSVTGSGTLTLKVQTDDNSGFTSASDRITSTAFAAVGKEIKSLAGALAGETHIRATWTVSGFTSVTFIVAAGVAVT